MKLMVCLDESNTSKNALKLAILHASLFSADLIIVTSMIKGTDEELKEMEEAGRQLRNEKESCEMKNMVCETHLLIRGAAAGEDLVQFANDKKVDLVYIGVKRRSRVDKILFGSTARYVILKANCPVVTVK